MKVDLSHKDYRNPQHMPLDAETWFYHPTTLLRVRLQPALHRLLSKGPTIRVLLVGATNFEPGLEPLKPKNGFVAKIKIYLRNVWYQINGSQLRKKSRSGYIKSCTNSRLRKTRVRIYPRKSGWIDICIQTSMKFSSSLFRANYMSVYLNWWIVKVHGN